MSTNTTPDLTYTTTGMFIAFFPETDAGKEAWNEIASKTNGTGKIFPIELDNTLHALRQAGYVVNKAKKPIKKDLQDILNELGA